MDKRQLLAINIDYINNDPTCSKLCGQKALIPIAETLDFIDENTQIFVKFRDTNNELIIDEQARLILHKSFYCIKSERFREIKKHIDTCDSILIVIEGTKENCRLVLLFNKKENSIYEHLDAEDPSLRLNTHDLPPIRITSIDAEFIKYTVYKTISGNDPELFSLRANRFLKNPHIITHLFSSVMSLNSRDNIGYIQVLR